MHNQLKAGNPYWAMVLSLHQTHKRDPDEKDPNHDLADDVGEKTDEKQHPPLLPTMETKSVELHFEELAPRPPPIRHKR